VVSFPHVSPPKPCICLSSPPRSTTCPAHLILLNFITCTILGGEEYISLSSSLCSFLHSHVTSSLLDTHPILKHPQPTFIPQCERPSFTPIHNNRQKLQFCISSALNFWIANWKTKDSVPNDSKHSLTSISS